MYDISDIDTVILDKTPAPSKDMKPKTPETPPSEDEKTITPEIPKRIVNHLPILSVVHQLDPDTASCLASSDPIKRVIIKKWKRYRWGFYLWFILHIVYVGFLTWFAIERSARDEGLLSNNISCPRHFSEHGLTNSYHFVNLFFALVYIFFEALRIVKTIRRMMSVERDLGICTHLKGLGKRFVKSLLNPYGNGWFRICFFLMAIFLLCDFGLLYTVECYDNYMLLCSVVIAWFLFLFFLRCWQRFSFFTLLIQRIVLNEMFSFFIIFGIQIAAFGTALYMLVQGTPIQEEEDYTTYWRLLFALTRLAVGNGELNGLYSTKYPGLAISIFVAYVIMNIMLLLNALIAVLSETATELIGLNGGKKARHSHFLMQRLSIIMFLENFIPEISYRSAWNKYPDRIKMKSLRLPGSPDNDEQEPPSDGESEEATEVSGPSMTNGPYESSQHDRCQLDVYLVKPATQTTTTYTLDNL